MKKLLFIALLLIGITSCNMSTFKKTDLPIEVVSLKEAQKFDTFYTIETENNVYFFDKTSNYISTVNKTATYGELLIIGVIVGFFLGTFFVIVILD